MSVRIAKLVQEIPRSGIRDFFEIVQSMDDVISLGIGEPDFSTPWNICKAGISSLEKGLTGYTSNLGLLRFRSAIAAYIHKHFHVSYDPLNEILVSVGVSEAIDIALRALLDPGDEVLYHEPCYVSYSPLILLAGGVPRALPTRWEDNFVLKAADIERAIGPHTRILMLNFPTNPTGATLPLEELERIATICIKHDLVVITDEIYSELTYDNLSHHSIAALPGMKERTILLYGLSKAFAMTGWRIGFACAPTQIIEAMMKIHQYATLCAPIMGQEAGIEALERGEPEVAAMRQEYELRRNTIVRFLNEMGLECLQPTGAFYVFPKVTQTGLSGREFSLRLLQEYKVAVVPGDAFGANCSGHIRCSYATDLEKIKIAMDRIGKFVHSLRTF